MAYASFIEQCYDELIEFVWAELPDMLEEYEATSKDNIRLPMLASKFIGDYDIGQLNLWPALILKPGQVLINPDNEVRALSKDLLIYNVSFWICVKGADVDVLQRQVDRYCWALKRIIDNPAIKPTQTTLSNAIRKVVAIDFHETVKVTQMMLFAGFVDVQIKTYSNR
jgi:hypothetical protein